MSEKIFLIDFDSTFIKTESLEELAAIALQTNPKRKDILEKMKKLTDQGMSGELSFDQSLQQRLLLLQANRSHIKKTTELLQTKISNSVLRNKAFFEKNKQAIYIISGGFTECILPVTSTFGILEKHIFANTFIFDDTENIVGFDRENPLSQAGGKSKLVKSLLLEGEVHALGDGYTDYQLKELGLANTFTAFIENVKRENVMQRADHIADSFEAFLHHNRLEE